MTAGSALDLGGFSLGFEGPDHPSRVALERRMSAFVGGAMATTDVELALRLPGPGDEGCRPHAERLRPRFTAEGRGARVDVDAPGFRGRIAAEGRKAHLVLDPARPVEDLEYFLRLIAAQRAFALGGLLMHAAAVVSGGGARVFFGPSGSGKTTLARNAGRRPVLNDDLIVLLPSPSDATVRVHATPFTNATQVGPGAPASAPLASLHQLEHATINAIRPLRPALAIAAITACLPLVAADPHRAPLVLERVETLLSGVPVGVLALTPDERFWGTLEAHHAEGLR